LHPLDLSNWMINSLTRWRQLIRPNKNLTGQV
jgi:hypothetical protein